MIPIYSQRKTSLVSWEGHILEVLSSILYLLKLCFFLMFHRYCLELQRIYSFFTLILNGIAAVSRRHWKDFCRYVGSRIVSLEYQPSRNFSECSVEEKSFNPARCPNTGMSDGDKDYRSPEDLFLLVCLRLEVGVEVYFKSDLDNDGNFLVWIYVLCLQSCPLALSGYPNIRCEMK